MTKQVDTDYKAIIVGDMWMGGVGSTERTFSANDYRGYSTQKAADADAIDAAYTYEAGDFQHVIDVLLLRRGRCSHGATTWETVKEWDSEEGEMAYFDTLPQDF